MATARETVLQALAELESETGNAAHRLVDITRRAMAISPGFQETTIRTYVTSVMCADAPVHHANHTDDLLRVDRGVYRRVRPEDDLAPIRDRADRSVGATRSASAIDADANTSGDAVSEWHWEGNIQAAMVAHLAGSGWLIRSVADTASRQRGVDIIAERGGERMLVEVKGYPSEYYVRGERRGQRKKTPPSLQARVWFSDLVLSSMLNADDDSDASIVLCLPTVPTYRSLAERTDDSLRRLGFRVAWVAEGGSVEWDSQA